MKKKTKKLLLGLGLILLGILFFIVFNPIKNNPFTKEETIKDNNKLYYERNSQKWKNL